MVKSDVHMERVRTRLVDESSSIKKSEAAKKQRDLKKYGKQIQHEKLKQRLQDKKGMDERIKGIKRKRKDGAEVGDEDGGAFDIRVEDAIEGKNEARGGGRGPNGKSKVSRVFFNSRCDTKPDHQNVVLSLDAPSRSRCQVRHGRWWSSIKTKHTGKHKRFQLFQGQGQAQCWRSCQATAG